MRRSLAVVASLLLLAACDTGGTLDTLRETPAPADPYHAALAARYKALSGTEANEQNWATADRFAAKGLAAAQGQDVLPEDPAAWEMTQPEFKQARAALIDAVAANRTTRPDLTAASMVDYDRWLLAAHSEVDANRTAQRRAYFLQDLNDLQSAHTVEPGIAAPSSEPVARSKTLKPLISTKGPTILYFPFDRDALDRSANSAIAEIATNLKASTKTTITLNGHTDRAGTEPYNMNLSERRAKFVFRALAADGVPTKRMHYFAFGESDPAVPTADGVREPKNRRVEIILE